MVEREAGRTGDEAQRLELPEQLDPRFFNPAPLDQQCQPFKGNEGMVLINLVRNEPTDPKLFDTTPPRKEDGWQIEVEEFRKRADEKP